jgi:hypothetical protein
MDFLELARRHEGTKDVMHYSREAPSNPPTVKFEQQDSLKKAFLASHSSFVSSCLRASQFFPMVQP